MTSAPRRFKVEPIETTFKSSKDVSPHQAAGSKPARRFAPEPIETSHKTSRRFAPDLVETAVKGSPSEDTPQPARRCRPEFGVTSRKTSREKFAEEWASQTTQNFKSAPGVTSPKTSREKFSEEWAKQTTRKFKPQPIETTIRSNRKQDASGKPTPRRFAPQLLETAKRSRRVGGANPAVLPCDKTEVVPPEGARNLRRGSRIRTPPPPPDNTPTVDVSQNPLFLEIIRATSQSRMRRPNSLSSMRSHHSFRVPDLDPIESSESEGSCPPSPTTSPSATSDHSYMYTEATRMRESVDDRSSGYLLELAAKAAEKQLREQAMAAFPNEDRHERVDHFIDRDYDDSDSQYDEAKRRRESSFAEGNLELLAMQQYRAELEKQEEIARQKKKRCEAEVNRAHHPWGNATALLSSAAGKDTAGGAEKDGELDRMRKGARPPMLGGDIKFPRCPSPEPARFDTTQGCDAARIAMDYLSEQIHQAEKGESLWCGIGNGKTSNRPSLYSNASSRAPSHGPSPCGLWGGSCVNTGQTPPRGPTGILTPRIEIDNPPSPCPTPSRSLLPPTPPPSNEDFFSIDEKLAAQAVIEEDFGDDFVTQVYNYLSLGYPSIARMFDEELARISNISLSELRQDDHLPTSRGYIRLGEDGNLADAEITEEACMRWRALRIYVREWAKQHPGMAADSSTSGGVAARKGSWAV